MRVNKSAMGTVEWSLLIALSILWGGSFFFNAVALADLPPFTVVFARVALAAAALWCLIAFSRPLGRGVAHGFGF